MNEPIFKISTRILRLVMQISSRLGEIHATRPAQISPRLRRENRIKTIHSSLAIENNTLSLGQVTAILDGKRILGNPVEIREVQNAADAYEMMFRLNPMSIPDLLKAHKALMSDLIKESGVFRSGNVGVFDGDALIHLAPSAKYVPELIADLFEWYRKSELPVLVKSSVFHYEFEFIHPFADGNGRMGRMWHTLMLGSWNEIFFWLPIEELIKERQAEYYGALGRSDNAGDCTRFVEVMLNIIYDSLEKLDLTDQDSDQVSDQDTDQVSDQVKSLLDALGSRTLSASELMDAMNLTHRPSFRKNYLSPALQLGLIEMTIPDKPNSRNQKYRRK